MDVCSNNSRSRLSREFPTQSGFPDSVGQKKTLFHVRINRDFPTEKITSLPSGVSLPSHRGAKASSEFIRY